MDYGAFPGGNGLYDGIQARVPIRGTLILGSNFGLRSEFVGVDGKLVKLDERGGRTWTPLLKILKCSQINKEDCFFTNAWPFLHHGKSNLGPVNKWLKDPALMEMCLPFFKQTLKTLRPKLIVALGKGPAAFLGHFWPESLGKWKGYAITCLDDLPMKTVRFLDQEAVYVAITHPSLPNARFRRPPYQYRVGEVRLLSKARLKSNRL